jgi:hypothetical protein
VKTRASFLWVLCREGVRHKTLFPVTLGELIPDDDVCRVIEVFVGRLDMAVWGFERAEGGRHGYDQRDLLIGYLQQIRSSQLESECRRNIGITRLLGRQAPDRRTIAESRRMGRRGITTVGTELVRLTRPVGLVKCDWIAPSMACSSKRSAARKVCVGARTT